MWIRRLALVSCLHAATGWAGAALTDTEAQWLKAGLPVLKYARAQNLPVDVIVQPNDQPDASPIAMGIQDGRCKLVLSMRGNPASDALSASVTPALFNAVAEAVFAHEIGHCWYSMRGEGNAFRAASSAAGKSADADTELDSRMRQMEAARQEEGFADLVGLAWTLRSHPREYEQVQRWLATVRGNPSVAGEHHDTSAWIRLAKDGSAFKDSGTVFGQVQALWDQGLLGPD